MTNIYEKYLLYSSKYFLISGINIDDNEKTIKNKSYYILNKSSPQEYIDHNLKLAEKLNDIKYLEYHKNLNSPPPKKLIIKIKGIFPIHVQSHNKKEIYKYIYDNHLQNKIDRRIIDVDDYLKSKLNVLDNTDSNYTYYNLNKYLKQKI